MRDNYIDDNFQEDLSFILRKVVIEHENMEDVAIALYNSVIENYRTSVLSLAREAFADLCDLAEPILIGLRDREKEPLLQAMKNVKAYLMIKDTDSDPYEAEKYLTTVRGLL